MSNRMPIAAIMQRIFSRGAKVAVKTKDGDLETGPFLQSFNQCHFFDVQVAHDVLNQQWIDNKISTDHVLTLPFPYVWLEWCDDMMEKYVSVMLTTDPANYINPASDSSIFGLMYTWESDWELPKLHPMTTEIVLNDDGGIEHQYNDLILSGYDEADHHELMIIQRWYTYTIATALSLINCRNVKTEHTGTVHIARSGAQKRHGLKPFEIRYRTILLPGGGSQRQGTGNTTHHRATALHCVRGHFKTFTKEKPLLGKHIGKYWWGWQVRGNPEKGVVVSDYKLDA